MKNTQKAENSIFTNQISLKKFQDFFPIKVNGGYTPLKNEGTISPLLTTTSDNSGEKNLSLKKITDSYSSFKKSKIKKITNYKNLGYYSFFACTNTKNETEILVFFQKEFLASLPTDSKKFIFFKNSVPGSVSIVTQKRLRSDPDEWKLTLNFFYDFGKSGPLKLDEITIRRKSIIEIVKLNFDCLLVLTSDKTATIYGKSYDKFGKFNANLVQNNILTRDLSNTDKVLQAAQSHKEFLLIKYCSQSQNGKEKKYFFIVYRISKLAKLMKIHDSQEVDPDRIWDKLYINIFGVWEEKDEGELTGLFIKYYTVENNSLYFHFEKLSKYGRFTNIFHKIKIQNLKKKEKIEEVIGDKGFDFIKISGREKIIRFIYDFENLFSADKSIDIDIVNRKKNNPENYDKTIQKLEKISENSFLEQKKREVFINLIDIEIDDDDEEEEEIFDEFSEMKEMGFKPTDHKQRDFQYYSNHQKALGDAKVLTPLFTRDKRNARNFSEMLVRKRKDSIGTLFSQEEYQRRKSDKKKRKSLFNRHEKNITHRKIAKRGKSNFDKIFTGDSESNRAQRNTCCKLI